MRLEFSLNLLRDLQLTIRLLVASVSGGPVCGSTMPKVHGSVDPLTAPTRKSHKIDEIYYLNYYVK